MNNEKPCAFAQGFFFLPARFWHVRLTRALCTGKTLNVSAPWRRGRAFHFAQQNESAGGFAACCRSCAAARARPAVGRKCAGRTVRGEQSVWNGAESVPKNALNADIAGIMPHFGGKITRKTSAQWQKLQKNPENPCNRAQFIV